MRARGSRLFFYSTVVLMLALMAGACGKSGARRRGMSTVAPAAVVPVVETERKLPPLPVRELSPELQAARERAMADASRLRGLAWQREVGMTPLTPFEYATRTADTAEHLGGDDLRALSRLAVAGGILPEGTDLASFVSGFASLSVGAAYSSVDKHVLLLYGDAKSQALKSHPLLTHEFVHALQDQHFDLTRLLLQRPYNFDRTEALFALFEGDATNVQRRLEAGDAFNRRTLEEIARAEDSRFDAYRRQVGWLFPALLTETFIFRYRDGARFVETLRRARTPISADELFRRPPASTEQVLHPEKYLSGEVPREVTLDETALTGEGWRLTASTTLGEIGVRGILLAGVDQALAKRAAAGWGGDHAAVFEREGRAALFVWKTVWDSARDAREFFDAYKSLKRVKSSVESDAQVIFREGEATTLVRFEGETVLVIRGAEQDVVAASHVAEGR